MILEDPEQPIDAVSGPIERRKLTNLASMFLGLIQFVPN